MKWIYILQCDNNIYYIGHTTKLYKSFWKHQKELGGKNTSYYIPENIVAIYPINRLYKFFEYNEKVNNEQTCNIYFNRGMITDDFNDDNEDIEYIDDFYVKNNIVEKMMIDDKDNWENIRGGKYVRFDIDYKFPTNQLMKDLPNCKCGLPCDIKYNEKDQYLYFRCAKKNIWDSMREELDIFDDPCNFFKKYTKDVQYKIKHDKLKTQIKQLTNKSPWLINLVGGQYQYCIGECGKEYDEDNTIRYSRRSINLCFDCFIEKNKDLSNKYTLKTILSENPFLSDDDC